MVHQRAQEIEQAPASVLQALRLVEKLVQTPPVTGG